MPRTARIASSSGYMHVIVRGIGRQILFENYKDCRMYLYLLKKYCKEKDVKIVAYCLMDNHVHLLTYSQNDSVSILMKKIGISYAAYFNKKYDRVGHLFQDRFKSNPIETEGELLIVFRYIIMNPQKAGIQSAFDYPWSSYALYDNPPDFMDLRLIHDLLGKKSDYDAFINEENEDICMEHEEKYHTDSWAKSKLQIILGISSGTEIQQYEKVKRNNAIKLLKKEGLSVRQIERLTGISRGTVQRIK